MKPPALTETFLRRQRRRSRGTLLAWTLAAALGTRIWIDGVQAGWIAADAWWAFVPGAVAIYLLTRWVRRVWRLDELALARKLDQRWELKARIESTVEMSEGDTAVAIAQRVGTERILATKKPTGTAAWAAGIAAVCVALAIAGAERLALYRHEQAPKPPPVVRAEKPIPTAIASAPVEPWRATIAWNSPAKSIEAKPTDEVPLLARVESNQGFRAASLEVAINGVRSNSYPLSAELLTPLRQPGGYDVKLSLFLDESGAKAPDVVSYYLRAEASLALDFPAVLSPPQFVRIEPVTNDPTGDKRFSPEAQDLLRQLAELREAQAKLIERNVELSLSDRAAGDSGRTAPSDALAADQARLAAQANEVRTTSERQHGPDLAQLEPAMTKASTALQARHYEAAAPFQARAFGLMVDAERAYREALAAKQPATASDPAKASPPATGLEPRATTPAGRLEALAYRQAANNRRLQDSKGESTALASIATEQAAIARELEKLTAQRALTDTVQKSVENATTSAAEAARQLGLNDPQAAREPAAETHALLQHAVEQQESEGRKAAAAMLEQVRRELNEATRLEDPAARAGRQNDITRELNAEAARQQRQGSADAAQKLAALARKLNEAGKSPPAKSEASPAAGTPGADQSPAGSPGQKERSGGGGDRAKRFVAELFPRPSAGSGSETTRAAGRAILTLKPDKSVALVQVTLPPLSTSETGAHLDVANPDGQATSVLILENGPDIRRYWNLDPVGGLTHHALVDTLETGNLRIQIDTALHPAGELGGQFILQAPDGQGRPPAQGGPKVETYRAALWPLAGVKSTAVAEASLTVAQDHSSGELTVSFAGLSGDETAAQLKVSGDGDSAPTVFAVDHGQVHGQIWRLRPAAGISHEEIARALTSGRIFLEIDSTAYPHGELAGAFVRDGGRGSGEGQGSASGNREADRPARGGGRADDGGGSAGSKQPTAAMPTLGTEARAGGALLDVSMAAAESQVALQPDNSLAQTIRQLKAATARLPAAQRGAADLSLIQSVAQKAQWLPSNPHLAEMARAIAEKAGGNLAHPENIDPALLKELEDQTAQLLAELEQTEPAAKRDEWVRRFGPEEIDPEYRKPVDDYFKKLSRNGTER